jgi:hypothetical protein
MAAGKFKAALTQPVQSWRTSKNDPIQAGTD